LIDSKVSRLIVTMGIASVRAQCNELELQLATHSPECDKPNLLPESKPEKPMDLQKSKRSQKDWCEGPTKFRTPEYLAKNKGIEDGMRAGKLGVELAKEFGVSESHISHIRKKAKLPPGTRWERAQDGRTRMEATLLGHAKPDPVKRDKELIREALSEPTPSPPKDERQVVIDEVRQGLTWRKIRKLHPDVVQSQLWWWVEAERKQVKNIQEVVAAKSGLPIIATADPDANGSSGFCSCGSVIKDRLLQKYGGDIIHQSVCGSCHRPIEECTCRKILIPPIPLAVREGARP
jgi:hypothetical protein